MYKTRNKEPLPNELYTRDNFLFQLNDSTQIQLENAKTGDFYGLRTIPENPHCQPDWPNEVKQHNKIR